ncbi:ABC transporter substrate-binding protein [Variovorax ginsengisoli]|uniref:ABC transporter substrate-binding protein n=1 Tax=Variovorax ginsengisoli TaxID=363844 RepID=A0ABT8S1B0_9BURK|nr:ABC transporter substrate-binding protein [Variovorax ginsengisoli]MDN8613428.1 ABC transporter substrate-binding protein [Variovorax ginsengisoli]MDO1532598.1 ABC transporter substrate-binding protein [Variovorax ginsengisoli]
MRAPRRQFITHSLAAAAALALPAAALRAQPRPVLKAGDQKGGLRALLEAAGGLEGLGYDIQWSEFPAAAPLAEALNAGAVDSGPIGDAPLVFALAAGTRVKAIGANRSDAYGTAVLVRPDSPLKSAADLKGRSIATNRGSIGHYVTLRAITTAGLKPEDLTLRFLAPADAKLALTQGAVDAWATWEPYTAMAETGGHAWVLVSGRGLLPGLSYLAATDAAIAAKRPLLQDFLRRVVKAQDWSYRNVDAFFAGWWPSRLRWWRLRTRSRGDLCGAKRPGRSALRHARSQGRHSVVCGKVVLVNEALPLIDRAPLRPKFR